MKHTSSLLLLLLALVAGPGCLKSPEFPTEDPGPLTLDASDILSGTLSPGGTTFVGYTLNENSTVALTFVSLTSGNTALSVPAAIGFGTTTDGVTCTLSFQQTLVPQLTAQMTQPSLTTGSYCVTVTDAGGLPGDVRFGIRIRRLFNPITFGQAGTETLSTNLYPSGVINRTFGVTANGTVTVTLKGVTPSASVGIGLGVTNDSVDECLLNKIAVASPGATAQLSANAEPGAYCVKVFDPGGLADRVAFTLDIAHP